MSSAKKLMGTTAVGGALAIEDVFSTYLYTGDSSTGQTITNGIDLAGEGGMVWFKTRSTANGHNIYDTERGNGVLQYITTEPSYTNTTNPWYPTSTGFFTGRDYGGSENQNGSTTVSWTFRKAPRFFDVVTYTGTGSARTVSHNLGTTVGSVIIKRTDTTSNWAVYHRGNTAAPQTDFLSLNLTNATADDATYWNDTAPTDSVFTVGTNAAVNASGGTYVAYLFAHDPLGPSGDGSDGLIACGETNLDANGFNRIELGWEPQWVLFKSTEYPNNWFLFDTMRGARALSSSNLFSAFNGQALEADSTDAEFTATDFVIAPDATGFSISATGLAGASFDGHIYIAIRRGPMRQPESGTEVFNPVAYTGTLVNNRLVDTGIQTDMVMARIRNSTSSGGFYVADRLRGDSYLGTADTGSEATSSSGFMTPTLGVGNSFSVMSGFGVGKDSTLKLNNNGSLQLAYAFRRYPGFFDAVCYSGTSVATAVNHNLAAVPEFIIVKGRTFIDPSAWYCFFDFGATECQRLFLSSTQGSASISYGTGLVSDAPTNSVINVGDSSFVNDSGYTYVAYLFASIAGISKVGSYTGTGADQQIDCGFTSGARFVLVKRTDSTSGWYVWDTARGIVVGNDPLLQMNISSAENSNFDFINPYSAGFEIVSPLSVNGGTYFYLAIA